MGVRPRDCSRRASSDLCEGFGWQSAPPEDATVDGEGRVRTDPEAIRHVGRMVRRLRLNGAKCDSDTERKIRKRDGRNVPAFFLPDRDARDIWIWARLRQNSESEASELRLSRNDMSERISRLDSVYDSSSDPRSRITKAKLRCLSGRCPSSAPDKCPVVSRLEADQTECDIQPLAEGLEITLLQCRPT